jgi:hypothetical protein
VTKTLIPYVYPTISLKVSVISSALGTVECEVTGESFNGSFGAVTNQVEKKILYRELNASSWSEQVLSTDSIVLTLDYTK